MAGPVEVGLRVVVGRVTVPTVVGVVTGAWVETPPVSVTGQTVVVTMTSVVTTVEWAGQLVTVAAHEVMVWTEVVVMVEVVHLVLELLLVVGFAVSVSVSLSQAEVSSDEEDEVVAGLEVTVVGGAVVEVVTGAAVLVVSGAPEVWVAVYVMHEQAELTALTSPAQFAKSVGMAEAAVVVPARNCGHHETASAAKRPSTRLR